MPHNKLGSSDVILSLVQDKIRLTKLNDQKDIIIDELRIKLNRYERCLKECQKVR